MKRTSAKIASSMSLEELKIGVRSCFNDMVRRQKIYGVQGWLKKSKEFLTFVVCTYDEAQ